MYAVQLDQTKRLLVISAVQTVTAEEANQAANIMDMLTEKEVASVTRVIPEPHKDIGLNILSQFHYRPNVCISTFDTLADAVQSIAAKADSSPG